MGRRSRVQQGGALAAVALAVTAPFGGLDRVAPESAARLDTGQAFALGPYDVTVQRVVSTPELEPIRSPETPGNRILSVVMTVENVTDRAEPFVLLTDALTVSGAGVVPGDAELALLSDGTSPSWLNPGMSQEVALVLEHDPEVDVPATVETLGYEFVDESALTLYDDYWLPSDEPVGTGELPVEVRR